MKAIITMNRRWKTVGAAAAVVVAVGVAAAATHKQWLRTTRDHVALPGRQRNISQDEHGHDHANDDHDHDHAHVGHGHDHAHEGDDHDHDGHNEANAIELSDVAWKNIGLRTGVVQLRTYSKTVSVPAIVVERPGRSQVEMTAPMTGVVTRVYALEGEAVQPGRPLFDLRLTHEDLVTAQRDFLQAAQQLDVVRREISRLEAAGEGVVAGRRVLEQQYEEQKLEAALHAQQQGLLLHGLTEEQINQILTSRRLVQALTVVTPAFEKSDDHHDVEHLFHVQKIHVKPGQHVDAGDPLGVLADHCLLYVEGQAFEDDAQQLIRASRDGSMVTVARVAEGRGAIELEQLKILYIADHIDPDSRALRFYLGLPNELVRDEKHAEHRFIAWKYRPGQRMEVKLPLGDPWEDQIVLPPEAVVEEDAETFVFQQNGDHFDRMPVHVIYRDKDAVVIENDGSLIGSTLAMSGAYQMHLAIKNKAGGTGPHAGHNH